MQWMLQKESKKRNERLFLNIRLLDDLKTIAIYNTS